MKTLLIEDHPMYRAGLAIWLRSTLPELELREAGTLDEALHELRDCPDTELVLYDLTLPDSEGTSGLRRVRAHAPSARVVVLSADERRDTVLAALDAGACGYIPKTTDLDATGRAFRVLLGGGVYLPESVRAPHPTPPAAPPVVDLGLSPRQEDVLKGVIEGKSNKLIGRDLGLSESTVKTHLELIFRKLDVSSRTQAVSKAQTLGWRPRAVQSDAG